MISQRAGVSKSTVSRALKGHPSISAKTRTTVTAIACELGYEPNAIARSLVTRRSGLIGFVIGVTENPFYEEQIEKITQRVSERGLQLMLFQVANDGDLTDVVPSMLQYRLDGCIVIASVPISAAAITTCARYRMSVVLLNRTAPETSASSVLCNSRAGAARIAEFLVSGGHRRIAFIAGRPTSVIAQDRESGFMAGLAGSEATLHAQRVGHFTFAGGYAAAQELIALTPRPDAIFAASDIMALAALDAIRDAGLRAAADISVVGFDDIRASRWPAYRLTTLAQPAEVLIERSIDLIQARMADWERPPEVTYVNGELRIRRSARVPADMAGLADDSFSPEPPALTASRAAEGRRLADFRAVQRHRLARN